MKDFITIMAMDLVKEKFEHSVRCYLEAADKLERATWTLTPASEMMVGILAKVNPSRANLCRIFLNKFVGVNPKFLQAIFDEVFDYYLTSTIGWDYAFTNNNKGKVLFGKG